MMRRVVRVVPVLLLASGLMLPLSTDAAGEQGLPRDRASTTSTGLDRLTSTGVEAETTTRFQPSPIQGEVTPQITPRGVKLANGGTERVIVKLAGDPVAVEQSRAAGARLDRAIRDQIKQSLKANQDALKGQIASLGGVVSAQFQVSLNAMTVDVPSDRLDALAHLPGVVGVAADVPIELDNAQSVPFIGAPQVWDNLGLHGEGEKIAIIDTGIDYTHANFGGPGTPAAFAAARASSTQPANPAVFGKAAPKVKGGIDLVGDDFDAASSDPAKLVPHPDPNPLDCEGHGSHVAGTAAGFGVLSDGATFKGPFNGTQPASSFRIGPGVAPAADLYAVRVFGCAGSTSSAIIIQALEWAVDNDMDVVNMSLGSPFGTGGGRDAEIEATDNAVRAGVLVVASAGNDGQQPYMTGRPASATRAISVTAEDSVRSLPGVTLALSTGQSVTVQNSNGASIAGSPSWPVVVLRTRAGSVSLGCDETEYAGVAGKLVVTQRGVCARTDRALFGQRHGAAAVAMINNAPGFPVFEGDIEVDPANGDPAKPPTVVTIPFLGVRGDGPDGDRLIAADRGTATVTDQKDIPNPTFERLASFTSGGPRNGDSALKPDITAPGVSIQSTRSSSGNRGARLSGTSMAAPHVTGVAALVRQAHPDWDTQDLKAAIVNTGQSDTAHVANFNPRIGGTGLVNPVDATRTSVVAIGDDGTGSLSFGFAELAHDFRGIKQVRLHNSGDTPVTFNVGSSVPSGRPHTLTTSRSTVTIGPEGIATVAVTLVVPAATVGDSSAFRDVAGLLTFTPTGGGVTLRVPYYLVPRAISRVGTQLNGRLSPARPSQTATVSNLNGAIAGSADFYAWGLQGRRTAATGSHNVRGVGVQSFGACDALSLSPCPPSLVNQRLLVFAVNTFERWSTASTNEFDVLLDVDGDGVDDFDIVGADFGALTAGAFDGRFGAFVVNLRTGEVTTTFLAVAPTDASTAELPILTTQLVDTNNARASLGASNPRFTYHALAFDITRGLTDRVDGSAKFNAFSPALSQGQFLTVAPNARASTTVTLDPAEWAITPSRGVMVVSLDNAAGASEAQLIDVR